MQAAEIESLRRRREEADARGREELAHSEALLKHIRWAVDEMSADAGIAVSRPDDDDDDAAADSAEGAPPWLTEAVERAR